MKGKIRKYRKGLITFAFISVAPILALILTVILFVYGEMKGIQTTYQISAEDIESPYALFDRVLLLNSCTKINFMELQDQARRNPDSFLDETYLEQENQRLQEKYSFLAVLIDGKFTYFGDARHYDKVAQGIMMENSNLDGDNAHYSGRGENRYLFKKQAFHLSDGKTGSVCIVTDLNATLPHITIFTVGLVGMVIVISVLVIIAIIGYAYYNIIVPIRNLQAAVIRISNGDLDEEIRTDEGSEFAELYHEFDSMRLTLKESIEERNKSDALTKEVIGNITHDLKTPLTAIKGYAEGILDGVADTPERRDKYMRTIRTKASDMSALVDELSYFTKIYQNEEKFNFSIVRVDRYFSDCIGDMLLDLETRNIQFLYQCYVDEETILRLDTEKIKRVVTNIIGNAVKYINHNHGILLVRITETGKDVTVMIRDNGKGIGKDELPHVFDRFYRTDSSRNSQTGGSGLGLAIAKKIVEEHNGEIWAESVLEKGTAMYFSIPKKGE